MGTSGWNRPSANQPTVKNGGAKAPNLGKGILAGLVVCVLALGVLYFMRDAEKPAAKKIEKKPTKIAEVTPAAAPKVEKKKEPEDKIELRPVGKGRVMKYVNGRQAWLYPRRNDEAKWGVVTTSLMRADAPLYQRIFHNPADLHIAFILQHEPGDPFGDGLDTSNFTQHFLEAVKDPVLVSHDDSEEAKELKRAVNEAKAELKAMYDAGENIDNFVNDTIKTYQELGQYREEIDKQIEELSRDPEVTKEEMTKFIDAANEMLKKKGLSDTKVPRSIWKRIERNQKHLLFQQPE